MGLSWNAALAAVFVSTLIFFLITITGLRETIVRIIPKDLKLAIGAGIGLFLAFIGLKGAGIIVADPANLVGLGALTSAPALLALIGILITIVLYIKKVPASVFIGLIITAIIGVIFTAAGFGVGGDIFMPALPKEIISFSFDTTVLFGFASGFGELFSTNPLDLIMILFSFLFFIFFDTTGTLISLAQSAGFPADENGEFKGIKNAFIGDAVGGLLGVILGTSPQTAYVESSTGIGVGGRTGLTAVFTGIFFLIAIVFSPLILSLFTSPVTACALVMVGILMMSQLKEVEWDNLVSVAAVFATIVMMLLTYSITLGIAFGFVTYAVAAIADGKAKEMHPLVWVLIIIFAIYLFFGL
jgi:AGZA family xanthine/uracil permease-like MFS transporter